MWIYKANDNGYPGTAHRLQQLLDELHQVQLGARRRRRSTPRTPSGADGRPRRRHACDASNWDSVGVFVKLNHKYITKLFGASINLTDHAVFRLEPAPTQLCG